MIARAVAGMLMWYWLNGSHSTPSQVQEQRRRLTDDDKLALDVLVIDKSQVLVPSSSFGCKFVVIDSSQGDVCVLEGAMVRDLTPDEIAQLAGVRWGP